MTDVDLAAVGQREAKRLKRLLSQQAFDSIGLHLAITTKARALAN